MIKITAKGLAKFMTAGESRKRSILRNFKFPDPEGYAQANYYNEARTAIDRFACGQLSMADLFARAEELRDGARASCGVTSARLRNNARAVSQFARNFPRFACVALGDVKLSISVAGVRVSSAPDLHANVKGRESLIRFDLSGQPAHVLVPSIVCQLMADAASVRGLGVDPKDCLYIEVAKGIIHRRARPRARISKDIDAACKNIAAIWPTV